jgi:hypothetical protein
MPARARRRAIHPGRRVVISDVELVDVERFMTSAISPPIAKMAMAATGKPFHDA